MVTPFLPYWTRWPVGRMWMFAHFGPNLQLPCNKRGRGEKTSQHLVPSEFVPGWLPWLSCLCCLVFAAVYW